MTGRFLSWMCYIKHRPPSALPGTRRLSVQTKPYYPMLDWAYRLSSDWSQFNEDCDQLREELPTAHDWEVGQLALLAQQSTSSWTIITLINSPVHRYKRNRTLY